MRIKVKKIGRILLMICIIAAMIPLQYFDAYAATGKISFSDPNATVGSAVSVTVKVETTDTSSLGSVDMMLSYDPNILEFTGGDSANGGAGSIKVVGFASSANEKTMTFQLNFNTLQAGTSALSVTSQEIYSFNEELMEMAQVGSSKVSVNAPSNYSNDASLKSLAISPGTLSPAFSASTTSYTASVGEDVNTLVVGAEANHSGAKLSISGNTNLKAGQNKITCKVTAEDNKTVKTYTINVTKAGTANTSAAETESESTEPSSQQVTVFVDGNYYTIAASLEEVAIPEGYEAETYFYKGTEVASVQGIAKNLRLFYLIPEEGDGIFYIYNEASDSFLKLQTIDLSAKTLTMIPLKDGVLIPDGYVETAVNIKGEEIIAYMAEDAGREFCLFYAMNWYGEETFYQYDFTEETAQRYIAPPPQEIPVSQNDDLINMQLLYNDLAEAYKTILYISYGLGAACLILIVIIFYMLLSKKGKGRTDSEEESLEDEIRDTEFNYESDQEKTLSDEDVLEDVEEDDIDQYLKYERFEDRVQEDEIEEDEIQEEQLYGEEIQEEPLYGDEIQEDELYEDEIHIEDLNLDELDLGQMDIEQMDLDDIDLGQLSLEQMDLSRIDLDQMDLEETDHYLKEFDYLKRLEDDDDDFEFLDIDDD